MYAKLDGNLSVTDAFGGLKNRPPPSARGVQNFLILGSQTRDGQGAGFGYDPGTGYPGTAGAGAAYVVARALTGTSASQNTGRQTTGGAGPVTLTIRSDFTGLTP